MVTQSYPTLCYPIDSSTPGFPVLSPSPRVCSNSGPLSQWCHPTNSSSVIPFSSCPQSFPASGSFPISRLFVSGGQSIGHFPSVNTKPRECSVMSLDVFWIDLPSRAIQFSETGAQRTQVHVLEPRGPMLLLPKFKHHLHYKAASDLLVLCDLLGMRRHLCSW